MKASGILVALAVAALPLPSAAADKAAPVAPSVVVLGDGLGAVLDPAARIAPIHVDAKGFFEGPAWIGGRGGYLIFSDIPGNALYRADRGRSPARVILGDVQVGHDGALLDAERNRYMVGPNGTVAMPDGSIVYCVFGGGRIERFDPKTGKRNVILSTIAGKPLVHPNDIALGPNGALYFTAETGLYRIHDGEAVLVTDAQKVNGLAFSPDGRFLYVTDHPNRLWRFAVTADGGVRDGAVFTTMTGDMTVGFVDGMKVDARGNVFAVGPGGVWVIAPDGRHIGTIVAPRKRFTNLAFGADGVLYLSAPEGLYRLPLRPSR